MIFLPVCHNDITNIEIMSFSPAPNQETAKNEHAATFMHDLMIVVPLFMVLFLVFMDHLVMVPLGADIAKGTQLNPLHIGYLIAIYPLTASLAAFLAAPFSDRWGRKKMLLILSFGFIAASIGCALSDSPVTIFLFRILSALFGGPIMPNVTSFVGDLFTGERRTRAITTVMLAFSVSSILGVPFGAWIGQTYSWNITFYIIAFISAVCLLFILRMEPIATGAEKGSIAQQYRELLGLWKGKKIRRLFSAQFFMIVGLFGLVPNLSVWLTTNYGMNATEVGLCYMQGGIGGVIGNQLSNRFLKISSREGVVSLGSFIMGVVILIFSMGRFTSPYAGIFFAGLMFGGSLRMPSYMLILTEVISINLRGRLMSMSMIISNFSMGIGGFWSTPLLTLSDGKLHGMPIIGWIAFSTALLVTPIIYSYKSLQD